MPSLESMTSRWYGDAGSGWDVADATKPVGAANRDA